MPDILKDGLAWLTARLKASASQAVTYETDDGTVEVQATIGSKPLRIEDMDGGIRIEWSNVDFLIPAADLVIGYVPVIPARGHKIYWTVGSDEQVYEVRPHDGEAPYRWSDPNQTLLRIHTLRVDCA